MIAKSYIFGRKYGANFLDGLVAYYPLNSNANDFSGNGYNGTLVNSPTFVAGKVSNAVDFGNDTTLRRITLPDNDDFSFTNGTNDLPFSISFWVNFTSFSSVINTILSKYQSAPFEWRIFRRTSTNRLEVELYSQNSNATRLFRASNSFTETNTWIHFVVTYNGLANVNGINIYKNGILNNSTATTIGGYVSMLNSSNGVNIGNLGQNLSEANKHRGLIDELAIWKNRELTATEVLELYTKGNLGNPII